jgi:predicted nucleotidyltransferase
MPSESGHLDDALLSRIRAICAVEPKVTVVYAFGSRISGQPRPDSDLDIGIFCESGEADWDVRCRLAGAIEDVVPWGVNHVDLRDVSVLFQQGVILEGRVVLARSAEAKLLYETRILALADDERYDQEQRTRLLIQKIEEGTFGGRTRPSKEAP